MRTFIAFISLLAGWQICCAQDIVIANARVIDGLGRSVERASVLVKAGRIDSIVDERTVADDALVIDAEGMTVMPGLINTHWHLLAGSAASSDGELRRFLDDAVIGTLENILERGITTIMSPGDHLAAILDVRQRLANGELRGPRLLAVGPVFTSPTDWPTQICQGNGDCNSRLNVELTTEAGAREQVRIVAEAGVDAIKLVYDDVIAPDVRIDDAVVAAIAREAERHGLRLIAHLSSTDSSATKLVDLGVRGFVHSAMQLGDGVPRMRELDILVITTAAVLLRLDERHRMSDPGFVPADSEYLDTSLNSIRTLWDAGVTVAFGTDSVAGPPGRAPGFFDSTHSGEGLFLAEVAALKRVLSNDEIIVSLTSNAAKFIGMEADLGSIERGKIADLVIIAGNPQTDIMDLEKVRVVIQGGRIVVDRR